MNVYLINGYSVSDELYHYGILGMKWGIRRFQNEDGSYTSEGKKRYGIGSIFGFGKKPDKKYTDSELNDLFLHDPDKIDYTKIDHKTKGNISEGVRYVSTMLLSASPLTALRPERVMRGAEFVSGFVKDKKYDLERIGSDKDPVTGFSLKKKEYAPEEDLKRVNPDYRDFNTNSKNNCMLCTVTTEMRRRGYDVTANKAGMGYFTQDLERWFPGVEVKNFQNGSYSLDKYDMERYGDLESQMLSDNPEGSRGNFMVEFIFGGGHSMFYEIVDGKLVIRDGQLGRTYTKEEVMELCSYSPRIQWARLDNVDFDPEAIKECCR